MSKKMLINVMHPEEARVAIVADGRLVELDIEIAGSEQTRGNIYNGTVVRVEPSLQAAFVDIGTSRLGFLQMGELHPDKWQWRDDIPEENRKRRPRIQEILRRGQELIVQVEKGERDTKGSALTTYISLPGRYMVLMPGSDSTGISRKVEGEGERKKLKEAIAKMDIPEGIGYIVRTEAVGKTKTELNKDLQYLLKLYNKINDTAAKSKSPSLIYEESDLISRMLRDYFTAEIDEVLVDSVDAHKRIKSFFKETMPKFEKLVKLHQEKRPIFSKYQLEEQIDLIYEKKVPLPSGGSLIIEPTEALVSIDVNSGKTTSEKGVEDTAFKSNLEAADEAARQLRLRDLGGLIVIDFIDMRDRKHESEVEKRLKTALKLDKARVTVGKISQFGMLEMSRQRIKQTLDQAIHLECPHCGGRGKVKSAESMALSFLRKVHGAAAKGTAAEVRGGLPLDVAYYLLNRKKRELAQIENDYEISVTVKGKPSFLMNQLELEVIKRDKPLHEEPHPHEEPEIDVPALSAPEEEPLAAIAEVHEAALEEVKPKKKRKRSRKKKHAEVVEAAETTVTEVEEPEVEEAAINDNEQEEHEAHTEEIDAETGEHSAEAKKKRRRRRRRRKTVKPGEEQPTSESSDQEPPLTLDIVIEDNEITVEAEPVKKGRPRRFPRKKKESVTSSSHDEIKIEAEPNETGKPRRKPRSKLKTEPESAIIEAAKEVEKPIKARRPRAKKTTMDSGGGE